MSRVLRLFALLLALTILVPNAAISQVPKPPDDTATMKARYLASTTVTGKITKADVDADPKKVTVQVSWQAKVLDDVQKKAYDDAMKNYQTAIQQKNKGNIQKFGQQAQQAQATMYKMQTQTLDLDFVCEKATTVRKNAAPPKNTATFKDLEPDTQVKVSLDRAKASKMKKDELEAGYPINDIVILPAKDAPK